LPPSIPPPSPYSSDSNNSARCPETIRGKQGGIKTVFGKKFAEIQFFIHKFAVPEITCLSEARIIFADLADGPGRSARVVVGKGGEFQSLRDETLENLAILAVHVRTALHAPDGGPIDIAIGIGIAFAGIHDILLFGWSNGILSCNIGLRRSDCNERAGNPGENRFPV